MTLPNRSYVFHRSLTANYPVAVEAKGSIIRDAAGKQYLDASGGAAVSCLGHSHPRILAAIKRQIDRMQFAHTSFFTNEPAEALAASLSARAPGGEWRVFFLSGGSEATEAALKLARQMQVERGKASRDHFISRRFSYHGNTLGALSVSGNAGRRKLYDSILPHNVKFIAPCFAYRHKQDGEDDVRYGLRAAHSLEDAIHELGDDRAIAFIAETVVGATLGAVPPAPGYFREIRRLCDSHGLFMILDEVMCGMGRTGSLFACEREGVVPDMITLAKGLGAGYQPIGALLVREEIVKELENGSGAFQHGHTYIAHAVAAAAALEVQRVIEEENLVSRVRESGEVLFAALRDSFGDHPHVGDIRGRGLLAAIELVADRATKKPFPASRGLAAEIKRRALDEGLLCYPGNGTADGTEGDHVLLAPAYTASEDEIARAVALLAQALGKTLEG